MSAANKPFTKGIARKFCDLIAVSLQSAAQISRDHPELVANWEIVENALRRPWFREMYVAARRRQMNFLMDYSLELASKATPQNAHAIRTQFDIYRHISSKLLPEIWGDKPQDIQVQTTVQIALPQQRLDEIRGKLESTRQNLLQSKPTTVITENASTISLDRTNGQSNHG